MQVAEEARPAMPKEEDAKEEQHERDEQRGWNRAEVVLKPKFRVPEIRGGQGWRSVAGPLQAALSRRLLT